MAIATLIKKYMSVRAYKILEIVTAKQPTFNCWHDEKILALADTEQYNGDGGIIKFCVEDIQTALEEALEEVEKDDEHIAKLKAIIADAGDEEWIEYYCY